MANEEEYSLKYTPTWAVAVVCTVFVMLSLALERGIHQLGEYFRKKHHKPLLEALEKLKEELMLLGFISLMLTVFQGPMNYVCIPKSFTNFMLPCKKIKVLGPMSIDAQHTHYCERKGKAPLLTTKGLHQLHLFIFVLAIVHVIYCGMTMFLANARIRTWKLWEDEIKEKNKDALNSINSDVEHDDFIKNYVTGFSKGSTIIIWMVCFFKQFYGSVTKSDYTTLRMGFIEAHCKANKTFDFHKYMVRTFETDFKTVVGISAFLWTFAVIFLLLDIHGWNTYFWISSIPLIILLVVGAKLEHIITQLTHEVINKNTTIEGEIVVQPSDKHFWFRQPQLMLILIHFILFQNAFEIAFFFWILTTFGIGSCVMGNFKYTIPRLVMGVIIQVLCSNSTFPLYALVSQMGTMFKKSIFDEHIQQGILGWRKKIKTKGKGKTISQMKTGIVYDIEITAPPPHAKMAVVDIPNSTLPTIG